MGRGAGRSDHRKGHPPSGVPCVIAVSLLFGIGAQCSEYQRHEYQKHEYGSADKPTGPKGVVILVRHHHSSDRPHNREDEEKRHRGHDEDAEPPLVPPPAFLRHKFPLSVREQQRFPHAPCEWKTSVPLFLYHVQSPTSGIFRYCVGHAEAANSDSVGISLPLPERGGGMRRGSGGEIGGEV